MTSSLGALGFDIHRVSQGNDGIFPQYLQNKGIKDEMQHFARVVQFLFLDFRM